MPFKFVEETEKPEDKYKFVDDVQTLTIPMLTNQNVIQRSPGFMQRAVQAAAPAVGNVMPPALSMGAKIAQNPPIARAGLEMGGAALGGAAGSAVGPVGALAGEALGYAGGKQAANILEATRKTPPSSLKELGVTAKKAVDVGKIPGDIAEGALYAGAGRLVAPILKYGSKAIGAAAKPIIGRLTGAGTASIEKALESGGKLKGNILSSQTAFDKALRGEMSGEDVVSSAKEALENIRDMRGKEYEAALDEITKNKGSFDIKPIINKTYELVKKFVPHDAKGKPMWDRLAIGKEGSAAVKDIQQIVEMVKGWGSRPGDRTAKSLDALKRQLDGFYSDSSKARSFVANLKNEVRSLITKNVPKYGEMTSEYAEATNLIKDIESGLMMRKQGINGRIVADQTLRRLVSAMKDNFPLRKELVNSLSQVGGEDVFGAVAGYALSPLLPRGLAGTGPAIILEGVLTHLNPAFAGLLALSSPRVMGEFLRLFGKGLSESGRIAPAATKAIGYVTAKLARPTIDQNLDKFDLAKEAVAAEDMEKDPSLRVSNALFKHDKEVLSRIGRALDAGINGDIKSRTAQPVEEQFIPGAKEPPKKSFTLSSLMAKPVYAEKNVSPFINKNYPEDIGTQLEQMATQSYFDGNYDKAIKYFQEAIKKNPEKGDVYKQEISRILIEKNALLRRGLEVANDE